MLLKIVKDLLNVSTKAFQNYKKQAKMSACNILSLHDWILKYAKFSNHKLLKTDKSYK